MSPELERRSAGSIARAAAVTGAIALIVAGCSDSDNASAGPDDRVKIAYLPLAQANPYTQATYEGLKEYADANNAEIVQFDGGFDSNKQQQQCNDAVTSGEYQLIVTIPVTPTNLVGCGQDAIDQGIAFVNTDFPLGSDPASGDPQLDGQTASVLDPATIRGEWIYELMEGACAENSNCEVALINGTLADPYGQAVTQVVEEKAATGGTIKIVAVREGGYLPGPSLTVAADLISANPGLDVIATSSDPMTVGAEQAVADAGKTGQIALIGGGYSTAAPEAIKSGRWYGTFLSLPADEGRLAAEYGLASARGDNQQIGVSASERSGKPTVITKDNIDELDDLEPQWQGE
ncbi:sugar ABC transporter substrate-binding protein [Williamsia sp.]|uniref:sugar ABC transporter substrate-binding protein n=1 Tax=Williamsia sp. TaxID=1872085 RepID=UPI002F93FAC4